MFSVQNIAACGWMAHSLALQRLYGQEQECGDL